MKDIIPKELQDRLIFGMPSRSGPGEESNATMPPELKEIVYPEVECEDCGALVQNRRINIKKNFQPVAYWRKECSICKQCEHPFTQEYTINNAELRALFRSLHCTSKNKPKKIDPDK